MNQHVEPQDVGPEEDYIDPPPLNILLNGLALVEGNEHDNLQDAVAAPPQQVSSASPGEVLRSMRRRLGDAGSYLPFSRLLRPKVPLIFGACQNGEWAFALTLLRARSKPARWELKHIDGLSRTALHLAVENDALSLEVVQVMLEKGYDVNAQDLFGDTPLHYAVKRRRLSRSLLKLLLEVKGVNINAANGKGRTCLHIAAATPKFPRELVNFIILKGGDVSKQSNSGRTPLNSAVRRSRKLVPIFLAHGADPFVRTMSGKNAVDWAKENNRPALQLRLEETRNVVVICMPLVLMRLRDERWRLKRMDEQHTGQNKQREAVATNKFPRSKTFMRLNCFRVISDGSQNLLENAADTGSEHDEQIVLRYKPPLIAMLHQDILRLVREMLF